MNICTFETQFLPVLKNIRIQAAVIARDTQSIREELITRKQRGHLPSAAHQHSPPCANRTEIIPGNWV